MAATWRPPGEKQSSDMWSNLGCVTFLTAAVIASMVIFKDGWARWFESYGKTAGRYQIIVGRTGESLTEERNQAATFKIDTATGKTWIFYPYHSGTVVTTPNEWVEIVDTVPLPIPPPSPAAPQ